MKMPTTGEKRYPMNASFLIQTQKPETAAKSFGHFDSLPVCGKKLIQRKHFNNSRQMRQFTGARGSQ